MYCGNCFRDNALVTEFRRMGHDALMVPLYLPLTLDEADQSKGTPIFFGGLNVYLSQKFNPQLVQQMKLLYEDELQRALAEDGSSSSTYISPKVYYPES